MMNSPSHDATGDADDTPRPSRQRIEVNVGAYVTQANIVYRIAQVLDFNTVIGVAVESGRSVPLAISDLRPLTSDLPEPTRDLSEVADVDWQVVQQRFVAIHPFIDRWGFGRREVEARAKAIGVDSATLYRWLERYRGTGSPMGLVPRKRGWRVGKTRIPAFAEAVIEEVIKDFYLTVQRPSVQKAIIEVQRRCQIRRIEPPSPSTVRSRINHISERTRLRERGYREKARNKFTPTAGKFPNADFPLAVVQIDHTPADIILVDDLYRKPIGRPWITLAIEVYSRMIAGYYLSFDAPSEASVAMCIAHAILPKEEWLLLHGVEAQWPVWGVPRTIHVDNGPDFRSGTFRQSCLAYGINLEFRPVKQPRYGGHIERVLGSLLTEIHTLPGTTFSSIKDKEGYDPAKHAVMTKSEFETWLVTYICKVYHERLNTGIGMSPRKRWETGIFGNAQTQGCGLPPIIPDRLTVLLDFLPSFRRTVQTFGVTIDSMTYYAQALRPWINARDPDNPKQKRAFIFRRDPRDISAIWFRDPDLNEYFKIPLADQAIPPMSIWEYDQAKAKLHAEGVASIHESQILRAVTEMRTQIDESKGRTKKARRQAQRRIEHEKGVSPATTKRDDPQSPSTAPAAVPTDLAQEDIEGFGDIA